MIITKTILISKDILMFQLGSALYKISMAIRTSLILGMEITHLSVLIQILKGSKAFNLMEVLLK
jgi:hypothetical protein